MKGDLVRPRCDLTFDKWGYGIISEINEEYILVVWIDNNMDHYLKEWEFEQAMKVVKCK